MSLLPYTRVFSTTLKSCAKARQVIALPARNLMSKQLVYSEFGDPLQVVKFREQNVPPLGGQDVLVRMLAAPVNPADINTIQGRNRCLPWLPTVPGDEGVGEVVEVGPCVSLVRPGQRVVLTTRLLGTWRYYGIYDERYLHVVSPNLPLPEAAMLTNQPCIAYRMLKDFRKMHPMQAVIQNAANSACGQSVIQLCRAWGIDTFNIISTDCDYDIMKPYLLDLGATAVFSLEEAEDYFCFNTSLSRPVLGLNCLGGRNEDVIVRLLERKGTIVYYGCAYNSSMEANVIRPDVDFNRFHLCEWDAQAGNVEKSIMLDDIVKLMVTGKFRAPRYQRVEMKNYVDAFRNTCDCEAFSTKSFVFDFTLLY